MLREQEFQDELARQDELQTEKKISAYESLLMDCKDAIQVKMSFLKFAFTHLKIKIFVRKCLEFNNIRCSRDQSNQCYIQILYM